MPRVHRLKHVERLAAPYLADDDPIRSHAQGVPNQVAHGDLSTMDLYGHMIDRNLWDATQRLGGTTGARPDEGPDDEGGALAESDH